MWKYKQDGPLCFFFPSFLVASAALHHTEIASSGKNRGNRDIKRTKAVRSKHKRRADGRADGRTDTHRQSESAAMLFVLSEANSGHATFADLGKHQCHSQFLLVPAPRVATVATALRLNPKTVKRPSKDPHGPLPFPRRQKKKEKQKDTQKKGKT